MNMWALAPDKAHICGHLCTIVGMFMDPKPRAFVLDGPLFFLPLMHWALTH